MWNEVTILWNELTILWNDLTTDWNDLTWNDLTMERNDPFSIWHIHSSYSCVNSSFFSCIQVDFSSVRRWYPKSNESQKNSKFLQQINTCKALLY